MIRVRIFKKRYKPLPGHQNRGAWCWAIDRPNARGFHTLSKGRANTWEEACREAGIAYLTQIWGESNMRQVQEFAARVVSVQVIPPEQWLTPQGGYDD